ncbi:MAG: hypothetical protein U0326_33495 [Polyangiales bacterium]
MRDERDPNAERGPGETFPYPETLPAHVVEDGPAPRIHGYAVFDDLARHASFGEVALLTLLGEEPTPEAARAFEVALVCLAPLSLADAAVHAATLARMTAGRHQAVLATGGIALAERAAWLLDQHASLFEWLDGGRGPAPEAVTARPEARASLTRVRAAVEASGLPVPALTHDLSIDAALLTVLRACGLRARWQVEAALVLAWTPALAAEAACMRPYAFKDYPFNAPPFVYEGSKP